MTTILYYSMVNTLSELDPKIVVWGMSCSGKTTFSMELIDYGYQYHCFDALFQWHLVETFGFSIAENLRYISKICTEDKYVLDGWHLSDKKAQYLPEESVVYVIYSSYDYIVDQYRVPLRHREEVRPMFRKWYHEIKHLRLRCRYFANEGVFNETTHKEFISSLEQNQ